MKAAEYDGFVRRTDRSASKSKADRRSIALYGLVGEIGSLVSAVKKKILSEGGEVAWDQPNEEIKEEIGDTLWYCYSLAQVANDEFVDILASDISLLTREIGGQNERAEKIRAALNPESKDEFLAAAQHFPGGGSCSFNDYQKLAFKTARTDGRTLLEVCLAVLPQLGAELLRPTLPEIELTLNKNIADRPTNVVLGEIAWHLAAIASLYHVPLNDVVEFNQNKVSFRAERGTPTPLHDAGRPAHERLPDSFEVAFVRVGPGVSRMYFEGRRLGNDLTDNATNDDGYRFHDVIHLALVAHLGWSPVVRGFMGRKRPDVDEVEDSGRAKVVEELVIKAIHAEGERLQKEGGRCSVDGPSRLFPDRSAIPFTLLKTLRSWVEGREVWKNAYWEWEDAIYRGSEIFFQLRQERQGTVYVDLRSREVQFAPELAPDIPGVTVGLGMGSANGGDLERHKEMLSEFELQWAREKECVLQTIAAKRALAQALGFSDKAAPWHEFVVQVVGDRRVSVRASGGFQERIWALGVVGYKAAFTAAHEHAICTIAALADIAPAK